MFAKNVFCRKLVVVFCFFGCTALGAVSKAERQRWVDALCEQGIVPTEDDAQDVYDTKFIEGIRRLKQQVQLRIMVRAPASNLCDTKKALEDYITSAVYEAFQKKCKDSNNNTEVANAIARIILESTIPSNAYTKWMHVIGAHGTQDEATILAPGIFAELARVVNCYVPLLHSKTKVGSTALEVSSEQQAQNMEMAITNIGDCVFGARPELQKLDQLFPHSTVKDYKSEWKCQIQKLDQVLSQMLGCSEVKDYESVRGRRGVARKFLQFCTDSNDGTDADRSSSWPSDAAKSRFIKSAVKAFWVLEDAGISILPVLEAGAEHIIQCLAKKGITIDDTVAKQVMDAVHNRKLFYATGTLGCSEAEHLQNEYGHQILKEYANLDEYVKVKHALEARINLSATKFQSAWKGYAARQSFSKTVRGIIKLQSAIRILRRSKYLKLLAQRRRAAAVKKIQRSLQTHRADQTAQSPLLDSAPQSDNCNPIATNLDHEDKDECSAPFTRTSTDNQSPPQSPPISAIPLNVITPRIGYGQAIRVCAAPQSMEVKVAKSSKSSSTIATAIALLLQLQRGNQSPKSLVKPSARSERRITLAREKAELAFSHQVIAVHRAEFKPLLVRATTTLKQCKSLFSNVTPVIDLRVNKEYIEAKREFAKLTNTANPIAVARGNPDAERARIQYHDEIVLAPRSKPGILRLLFGLLLASLMRLMQLVTRLARSRIA